KNMTGDRAIGDDPPLAVLAARVVDLEGGAVSVVPALSSHDGEGQAEARCGHRNRTRAGRVRLVCCLHHDGSAGKKRYSNDGIGRGLSTGGPPALSHAAAPPATERHRARRAEQTRAASAEASRRDDQARSPHRLTKPGPDHHPACTAEGGNRSGQSSMKRLEPDFRL